MFTNKTSRKEQEGDSNRQQQYIEPFDEPNTEENGTKQTSSRGTTGYMAELEQWLDEMVFDPIDRAIESEDAEKLDIAFIKAKNHIKRRVLASYHNGLKAKTSTNQKTYGQQNYRRN